jgi:hypothetical protein
LDRSHFVNWDIQNVSAQTHQKFFFKPISTQQTGYNSIKFLRSFFQKATVSPELHSRTLPTHHGFPEI